MSRNLIRPEWVPSGYREEDKREKIEDVKASDTKQALSPRKDLSVKRRVKRSAGM